MRIIHLLRKPLSENNVAANVLKHGCGVLHVDACRLPYEDPPDPARNPLFRTIHGYALTSGTDAGGASWTIKPHGGRINVHAGGRWPANLVLDSVAIEGLDQQSLQMPGTPNRASRLFKIVGRNP